MIRSRRLRCVHIGLLWLVYSAIQVQMATVKNSLAAADDAATAAATMAAELAEFGEPAEANTSPNPRYDPTEASAEASGGSSEASGEASGSSSTATPPHGRHHHTHPTYRPKRDNCTPPAIEQFPRTLMGPTWRRHGGLIIHLAVAVFTFFGLAIVCEDYFVASLDRICEGEQGRSIEY